MQPNAIVPAQSAQNNDITLTNPEQIDEFFERAETLIEKVGHVDNQSVIRMLNNATKKQIEEQNKAWVYLPQNSPLAMANEYQTFLLRLIENGGLINSCDFCERAMESCKLMKSTTLSGSLNTLLNVTLTTRRKEFEEKFEAHRRRHIEQREDTSVRGLTFVAYGVYLNVISSMVPGVSVHIPVYALVLSTLGVIGNHLSTEYRDYDERMHGAAHVVDRVVSSSGLRYCWNTLVTLTEKTSIALADRVNQYMAEQPADKNFTLPSAKPAAKKLTY